MGWRATGKLSSETYKGYLLKCKKSSRNLLQNFESQAEKSLEQLVSGTASGNNFKKFGEKASFWGRSAYVCLS